MLTLVILAAMPGQFVENPNFDEKLQKSAFDATAEVYHKFSRGEGSAVVVHRKGDVVFVLTAAHNVATDKPENPQTDPDLVELTFYSSADLGSKDKRRRVPAKVISRMANEDLAVLRAEFPGAPTPVRICPKNKLPRKERGLEVMTVGCPRESPPLIQFDEILGVKAIKKPDGAQANYWETRRAQEVGRSGGPLIDSRGYVLGICSGTENKKGYYTHVGELHDALRRGGFSELLADETPKK